MKAYRCPDKKCGARWIEDEAHESRCPECHLPVGPSDRPPSPIREKLVGILAGWLKTVKAEGVAAHVESGQSLVADMTRVFPIAALGVARAFLGVEDVSYLREVAPDEYDDMLDRLVELVPDQGIPLFLAPAYAHGELAAARAILLGERRASA